MGFGGDDSGALPGECWQAARCYRGELDHDKIYVATVDDASVTIIDGTTNTTSTVDVGKGATSIAVNSATNKVYVMNSSGARVTVIDGATNLTTKVDVGKNPHDVVLNAATNKVYVMNRDASSVTVIDGVTNATIT